MALINLLLHGKGGVGKFYITSLIAHHYQSCELPLAWNDLARARSGNVLKDKLNKVLEPEKQKKQSASKETMAVL